MLLLPLLLSPHHFFFCSYTLLCALDPISMNFPEGTFSQSVSGNSNGSSNAQKMSFRHRNAEELDEKKWKMCVTNMFMKTVQNVWL